ncbi:MAG TPA: GxxExxY protein [Candidatus Sulfotelmatobacter sp.]|jgi:GxxExxY protein|nr:GxxExxY protein [Candidatus Sulfotelmatobacter sp.]
MNSIIYKLESYEIMGACFEVYKEKGNGFLEPVYQECLELELAARKISFIAHPSLALTYKGQPLKSTYKPDFICMEKIVLEIKSVSGLTDAHRAQVQNYLKATKMKLGLLVNFSHYPKLEYERIVL